MSLSPSPNLTNYKVLITALVQPQKQLGLGLEHRGPINEKIQRCKKTDFNVIEYLCANI